MSPHPSDPASVERVEAFGAGPFVTRRVVRRGEEILSEWRARRHRKGLRPFPSLEAALLGAVLRRSAFLPRELNWWIGAVFAVGSALFVAGGVLWLAGATATANVVYFAGSIPFTTAAYLSLNQAANAPPIEGPSPRGRRALLGWRPRNAGWLSCALQFAGTLLFNLNTYDAMLSGLDWPQEDLAVWTPDVVGSVLFLASGVLAYVEAGDALLSWRPSDLSWLVTATNLAGCIGFMISALFAPSFPPAWNLDGAVPANAFTLIGALGFLVSSLLMLPEAAGEE